MTSITGYWALPDYLDDLLKEISFSPNHSILSVVDGLVVVKGPPYHFVFAQNIWPDLKTANIQSIGDGARTLKEHGVLWLNHSSQHRRRSELIQQGLAKVKNIECDFLTAWPPRKVGGWLLETEQKIWFSQNLNVPFNEGVIPFKETQEPPSRAYMKLWEVFTREKFAPQKGQHCLEIGACPGGWTWVLDQLGCEVVAIDRSPLDPETTFSKRVSFHKGDAFAYKTDWKKLDWILSDLICYPEKLLNWVQQVLAEGFQGNFVCTIKFQGETDFKTMAEFQKFQGSHILHLSANKHEVTWYWLRRGVFSN